MRSTKKSVPWLLLAVVSAAGVGGFIHAGANIPAGVSAKDQATARERGFPPPRDWMADPWTGSDAPFATIRAEVDKISDQNQWSRSTLESYRKQAASDPKDPAAQFRWAYAYYKSWNDGVPFDSLGDHLDTLRALAWDLEQAPSPHSYEYTRLLYLISASDTPAFLTPVGKRLLRHTPKDYAVEFYFYPGLLSSPSLADRKEALLGAQNLVREFPATGGPYAALASIYLARWNMGDKPSGPLAVAAYQKYLSMPPRGMTPETRKDVEYLMNFIRTHPGGPKGPKIR